MGHSIRRRNRLAASMLLAALIAQGALAAAVAAVPAEKSEAQQPTLDLGDGSPALSADAERRKKSAVGPAQIKDALLRAAARLVDLKLAVVEKGDGVLWTVKVPVPVIFKEAWMHGRTAQVHMVWRDDSPADRWWTGFKSLKHPLTSADLTSLPGLKDCVDLSRDLVFADSRPLPPGRDGRPRTLHSVSKSPHFPSILFVPLVEFDKPWNPVRNRGGLTVVDQIACEPLPHWRVLGEETMGGEAAVLAEIAQYDTFTVPLKRHAGGLSLTQGYLAWFSKKHGLMPLRVELTMRYGYGGREYRLERRPDGKTFLVYVASDFLPFRDVWVPRTGSQATYQQKGFTPKSQTLDADALVDKLLADGTMRLPTEMELGYQREWRVLNIEPIDPSLDLWFQPQPGAEVLNMDTHKRYIEGDAVASARFAARENAIAARVGHAAPDFPKGATWLNSEALSWQALCGKVVILDFWSIDCGACLNDLPRLRGLYTDRAKTGLAVIGVHLAGWDLKAVKKGVGELHFVYPMCIDSSLERPTGKPEDQNMPSEFTAQFGINAIPHFVVVDQHGIVAASESNRFLDALTVAQRLAKTKQ